MSEELIKRLRADFERLHCNKDTAIRNEVGDYVYPSIQDAWGGWLHAGEHYALTAQQQEPVAWQYRRQTESGWGEWRHLDCFLVEETKRQGQSQVRELYTAPQSDVRESQPAATVQVPADAVVVPDILFDGYAVYKSLSDQAKTRTSAENVSDTLDAVVRLMRNALPEADK